MSLHRSSIQDTAARPPLTSTHRSDPSSPPAATSPAAPTRQPRHAAACPLADAVVVALSLFAGLAAAALGVTVSAGGTEPVVDALVLLGFAAGWALLLVLSMFLTDHPQTWAAVPAAVMVWAVLRYWSSPRAAPPWTPLAGCGRPRSWACWSGSVPGPGNCRAAAAHGCSTRSSRSPPSQPSAGVIHIVTQTIDQASAETLPGLLHSSTWGTIDGTCPANVFCDITVTLEPGLGGACFVLAWDCPQWSPGKTRVCVYLDRGGRGRSDPAPQPRDCDQISTDLHTLLEGAGRPTGPLVMVGHSLGALYAPHLHRPRSVALSSERRRGTPPRPTPSPHYLRPKKKERAPNGQCFPAWRARPRSWSTVSATLTTLRPTTSEAPKQRPPNTAAAYATSSRRLRVPSPRRVPSQPRWIFRSM